LQGALRRNNADGFVEDVHSVRQFAVARYDEFVAARNFQMAESSKVTAEVIDFSLLENGLDFISSGLRYIVESKTKSDLKYAVLHLSSGIDLVLKERLAREDWRLLFLEPDHATEADFKSGNFQSVRYDQCLKRLEDLGIAVPNQARLRALKSRRNRFEHFRVEENKEVLEAVSIGVLSEVLDFISEELDPSEFSSAEDDLLADMRARLVSFGAFTKQRLSEVEPFLVEWRSSFGQVVECPCCAQETLQADCDVVCVFCGYKATAQDAAELYIANVIGGSRYYYAKDGGVYPLHNCPNCENEALVYEEGYSETSGTCFACGYRPSPCSLELCDQCGEPHPSEERSAGMCLDCYRDYYSADHR
jgi:hypothetical protein